MTLLGTFFNPSLNGSESSSALAVGGVGGTDEHTPNVDMTTTKKAGEDITQSLKNEEHCTWMLIKI